MKVFKRSNWLRISKCGFDVEMWCGKKELGAPGEDPRANGVPLVSH